MGNRADEYGTDVEIYRKALSTTIHADTPTDASEQLLDLLDQLGLERKEVRTAGPVYIWHEAPAHLDADEQRRLATRAIPALLIAGYQVNCTPEVFDKAAYQQAMHDIRARRTRHRAHTPVPAPATSATASPRHTP
ncbi:hypothetical protein [Streptomyces ureilyticus]|uniref:Uncharacterized protein n=1 Tax=Streptomyces ureilyticus TaxID=1775131 RepID=A0ABX0E5P3_9ACTN|nr:hypothetical protein [Streptomyces ureilyticus]NGO48189.1 hypothetical protein [Streptomyces ureilyticus]